MQRVASTPNLANSKPFNNQQNSVKSSSFAGATSGGIKGIQSTPAISNIRTAPTQQTIPTPNPTQTQNSTTQQAHFIQPSKSTTQSTTPSTTPVSLAPQFVNPKSVPASVQSPSVQQEATEPQDSQTSAGLVRTPVVQSEEERGRPISRKAENVQRLSSIKLRRTQSNRRIESRDSSGWVSLDLSMSDWPTNQK